MQITHLHKDGKLGLYIVNDFGKILGGPFQCHRHARSEIRWRKITTRIRIAIVACFAGLGAPFTDSLHMYGWWVSCFCLCIVLITGYQAVQLTTEDAADDRDN